MKKILKMLGILIMVTGITTVVSAGPNQDVGTLVGGIAGGLLGNQVGHGSGKTVATIGGAVVGSLVGNQVGQSVDTTNRVNGECHRYSSLESRTYYPHHHSPRYLNAFIGEDGRLCRHIALRDEYGAPIYGTVCCHHMLESGRCVRWVTVR